MPSLLTGAARSLPTKLNLLTRLGISSISGCRARFAKNCVGLHVADYCIAVFDYSSGGQLTLIELMPGATFEQVRASTSASFVEKLLGDVLAFSGPA
jgi:acyl CoA:acetate/3-ketoacid CoA transferase beta subunit